jgi:hypothetical protein
MSNGQIIRLIPFGASQCTAAATDGIDAAFPAANFADPQPKTVVQTVAAPTTARKQMQLRVDLGADTPLDTVAVLWTNLGRTPTMDVYAAPASAGGFSDILANQVVTAAAIDAAPVTLEGRRFGLASFASVSRRYISVIVSDDRFAGEVITVGVLALGQTLPIGFNFELGSGRKVEDQSITRLLPGGETAIWRGGRVPSWRGTWSNLTEAEYNRVWSLLMEVGNSAPVLIIEDPDRTAGQSERMHYGLITSSDFTERVQLEKQRIDIVVRELV